IAGFCRRLVKNEGQGRGSAALVATLFVIFALATFKRVADVTQVAQLGRYYLPVFALLLPSAISGIVGWLDSLADRQRVVPWLALTFTALVWADPTWAYDASWYYTKRYQLHWPGLLAAGEWIKHNPDRIPPQARIMTWFPWELRVTSDRTTILMPRNYSPRR